MILVHLKKICWPPLTPRNLPPFHLSSYSHRSPLAQHLLRRPLSISEDRAEGDDGDGSGGGDGDGNDGGRGSADSGPKDSEDGDGSDGEEGVGKVVHELKKRLPFMLSYRYTGVLRS